MNIERIIMNKEYHEPFIKGLIVVAVATLITMISSKFIVEYYYDLSINHPKILKYSSSESNE